MLFNSIDFAIFLPIVFFLYWSIGSANIKLQNIIIILASYIFYAWWDYRFLGLIIISSLADYGLALLIDRELKLIRRKALLWVSICLNIGLLGFFKYYNFFVDNFVEAFSLFGTSLETNSLNIILPVGISFYTFQTLSYTIDVYKKKITVTKDLSSFAAFVAFFPQLVAGPIERASNLLPQFTKSRKFEYYKAVDGLRQILWGLFKKIVIADNCAKYVDLIFDGYLNYSSSTLVLGALFFAFQIYGDFSGYSDIAIGTSRLFGFNLKQNFAFPYFSRDIAEFWRRWHISLSTWFRDYLYIPLGGSRGNKWQKVRNVFIIFLVSGFWHGANWTFIAWGFINALYFLPLLLLNKNRKYTAIIAENSILPSFKETLKVICTFALTLLAWVFFRAETLSMACDYIINIYDTSIFSRPKFRPTFLFLLLTFFISIEWLGRRQLHALETLGFNYSKWIRRFIYNAIAMLIFLYSGKEQEFIYFQF